MNHKKIVLSIVFNRVLKDPRVLKSARSALEFGYHSHIFGVSENGQCQTKEISLIPNSPEDKVKIFLASGHSDFRQKYRKLYLQLKQMPVVNHLASLLFSIYKFVLKKVWQVKCNLLKSINVKSTDCEIKFHDCSKSSSDHDNELFNKNQYDHFSEFARRFIALHQRVKKDLVEKALILKPDIIHAHDMNAIEIATHIKLALKKINHQAIVIYDAHEYVAGSELEKDKKAYLLESEAKNVQFCDRFLTVSQALADKLKSIYPHIKNISVINNCPYFIPDAPISLAERSFSRNYSIKKVLGLNIDQPLVVFSGAVTPGREPAILVEAIKNLPKFHLAYVAFPSPHLEEIKQLVTKYFLQDRVFFQEPVPHNQVTNFLSDADVGAITFTHFSNAEVALPNKIFDYIHAGIPVVSANTMELQNFINNFPIGNIYQSGDAKSLANAIETTYRNRNIHINKVLEIKSQFSWNGQHHILEDLYSTGEQPIQAIESLQPF